MIEALGKWIVTICVAIFFSTAVHMLFPKHGNIYKYCDFVLGLIVFAVMINPLVEFFNSGQSVAEIINKSSSYVFDETNKKDYEEYRKSNIDSTVEAFRNNLNKQCVEDLKENFGGKSYRANFSVSYNNDNSQFSIESVEIDVDDGSVERIKEVKIGQDSLAVGNTEDELGKQGIEIKNYVSSKYDIDKNKVYVYKASSSDAG